MGGFLHVDNFLQLGLLHQRKELPSGVLDAQDVDLEFFLQAGPARVQLVLM